MSLYLFIDGAYLHKRYSEAMQAFYGTVPTINYRNLSLTLPIRPQRIYYYDAVDRTIGKNETETECNARVAELDRLHSYLNSLPLWHVREGFVSRGRRVPRPQKAVDVQLAVDALEHAVARNMTQAAFIFGDLDFEPLLFSLNRFGIDTTVFYEPHHAAEALLEAADIRNPLTLQTFHDISDELFRSTAPRAYIQQDVARPDVPVVRRGTWKGRSVQLMREDRPGAISPFYIAVDSGPSAPVREPSLLVSLTDPTAPLDQTELLFTMTHGGLIVWE